MSDLLNNTLDSDTDTAVLLAAIAHLAQPKLGDKDFTLVPKGFEVEDLERFWGSPRRTRQEVEAATLKSFKDYVNRFLVEGCTALFADPEKARVLAILDYHEPNGAQWGDHVVTFNLPKTPEWRAWEKHNKQSMTQSEFAEFVEEHIDDFHEPGGAEMLTIANNFRAKKNVDFSSNIHRQNGDVQLTYTEKTEAATKDQITVPETFTIAIPPFRDADSFKSTTAYMLKAYLRFRINSGRLTMWYKLHRPDLVREDAFGDVVEDLEKNVDAPLYLGVPR